nr:restriction endonuclease [Enterococcus sp. CSURQ0835]
MDGIAFENYTAKLLEFSGFENIQVSQASNDQGIDVFAEKNGLKYGIQCKCYSSPVGNKAVQEVIAGALFFKLDERIVLTNNFFTPSAKDLARKTNVVLWDQLSLKNMISIAISIDPEFSNYEASSY